MCGEIDEQVVVGQEMLDRFRAMARRMGLDEPSGAAEGPRDLAEPEGRAAYLERTFQTALTQAMADVARAEEDETVDALALQAIAFARLAGFLAGQLPPEADLFRAVIEAMTAGHAEPRELTRSILKEQEHHHHPHHDHDDGHGHHHHGHHHHPHGSDHH